MPNPLPKRILIPIDVGEVRRRALDLGVRLANVNGAEIILLTVVEDRFPYPDIFSFHSPNKDYYKTVRDRAYNLMSEAVSEVAHDVTINSMCARGNPARVIVEVADEEDVDLIIMTTHTTRGIEHAILGSVTDKVLRTATCPVLVIPIRRRKKSSQDSPAATS